jgi:hypothetical protein
MSASHADPEPDPIAAAVATLIGVSVPAACRPGVTANLAILAHHAVIVRAAAAPPRTEAAEVFTA